MPVRRHLYDYKRGNFKDLCSLLSHVPFDIFVIALSGNIDECWIQLEGLFCQLLTKGLFCQLLTKGFFCQLLNKNDHNKLKLRSQSQHVKYLLRRKHDFYLEKYRNCI